MHIRVSLWLAFLPPFPLLGQLLAGCKIWNTFWKTSFLGGRFFTPLGGWRNNWELAYWKVHEPFSLLLSYLFGCHIDATQW